MIARLGGLKAFLILAAGLLSLATATDPAPRFTMAKCRAQLDPKGEDDVGYECLYAYARTSGDYDAVESLLREHIEKFPRSPWPRVKLAAVLADRAKPGAVELYREAFPLIGSERPAEEAMARLNLSTTLRHRGDDDEALVELSKARALATAAKHAPLQQAITLELARFHTARGGSLREIGRLLDEVGDIAPGRHQTKVNYMHTRAAWLARLGKFEEALAERRALADFARDNGDPYVLAVASLAVAEELNVLAEKRLAPDRDAYRTRLLEAHQAAADAQHVYAEADALCKLSGIEGPGAVEYAQACHDVAAKAGDDTWSASATLVLAAALRRAGQVSDYDQALLRAIGAAARLGDPEFSASVAEEEIRSAWLRLPRAEAVARTRTIVDRLDSGVIEDEGAAAAGRRSTWHSGYDFAIGKLLSTNPSDDDVVLALGIAGRQRDDDLLHTGGETQSTLPDPLSVLAKLPPGHGILAFSLANDLDYRSQEFRGGAWAWLITSETIEFRRLPPKRVLAARVSALVGVVSQSQDDWSSAAAALRNDLLGDGDWIAGLDHLTVIPDEELFELPFALLLPGVALDTTTSLESLKRSLDARVVTDEPMSMVAFGDPSIPEAARERKEVDALPFARREVEQVLKAFDGDAVAALGADATESMFTRVAAEPGVLHVAAHALIDSAEPERSALVFAADASNDGLLTLEELLASPVARDLVVLSACDSAAGPLSPGIGLHGLAQTFRRRGVETVVGTLWPIRDDEAMRLFESFYERLATGLDVATALRLAQDSAQARGVPAQTWGSVVVLGDGGLVASPKKASERRSGARRWGWILPVGLLVLSVFVVATRK